MYLNKLKHVFDKKFMKYLVFSAIAAFLNVILFHGEVSFFFLILFNYICSFIYLKKIYVSTYRPETHCPHEEIIDAYPLESEENEVNSTGDNSYNQIKATKNVRLVEAMALYIQNNLHADLSIEKLSEIFYMSSSHIRKVFKEESGETIKEYINRIRIEKAKLLLEDTHVNISVIAEKVGYMSLQAFCRSFKIHTGKSPGVYRAQRIIKKILPQG